VVVGASGDLAKKKTYPSLLNLYDDNLLPRNVQIWGYARSPMSDADLRNHLRPYLLQSPDHGPDVVDRFLNRCVYRSGDSYGDEAAFAAVAEQMEAYEQDHLSGDTSLKHSNRLFYFAIPPSAFAETAIAINNTSMQDDKKGWTRLIVEKPFGRDLQSFESLNQTLADHFTEQHIYRIDHYLGKELVQNLTVLRFSNLWLEKLWSAESIQSVILTFKEPFGTEGRGGYFDQYGIIRDILQVRYYNFCSPLCLLHPCERGNAEIQHNSC
jgi:glucose-6-phosphate 1-dehydrogenase